MERSHESKKNAWNISCFTKIWLNYEFSGRVLIFEIQPFYSLKHWAESNKCDGFLIFPLLFGLYSLHSLKSNIESRKIFLACLYILLADPGCSKNTVVTHEVIMWIIYPLLPLALLRRQAQTVRNNATSHKINYVAHVQDILNLKFN